MAEHTRRPSSDAARKSAEIGQRAARKSAEIGQRAARKSAEIGQRAATDAARKLVSTLEGVTPAALADSELRKSIVDAAADWADWLITAHALFLGGIAHSASEAQNEGTAKPAAKGAAKPADD
jgi:hypothetical protein